MRYLKYIFLTDTFLINGHLNTGGQRLSTFLNNTRRRLLNLDEVTLVNHIQGDSAQSAALLVRTDEILLAHELEEAGDERLRLLAEQGRDEVAISAHCSGTFPFQLSGSVSRHTLDRCASGRQGFIVILRPRLLIMGDKAVDRCAVFESLPYVIVNSNRLALIAPDF
jgi:hypothetical protein